MAVTFVSQSRYHDLAMRGDSRPDRERFFSDSEIADLLRQAEAMGFSLEAGSELEQLTIAELQRLLEIKQ